MRPAPSARERAPEDVRGMFDAIAPTYDRANHLLSLWVDRYWRRRAVAEVRRRLGGSAPRILDLCCGTGDLALALRRGIPGAELVGADFSLPMLRLARRKGGGGSNAWLQADGLKLPFGDASFAAVTVGFGFRNLSDYAAGLAELRRVLAPGGVCAILEAARPGFAPLRWYLERVLPRLGGWISGNAAAYRYFPDSVAQFPAPAALAAMMRAAGFGEVSVRRLPPGLATLHLAS